MFWNCIAFIWVLITMITEWINQWSWSINVAYMFRRGSETVQFLMNEVYRHFFLGKTILIFWFTLHSHYLRNNFPNHNLTVVKKHSLIRYLLLFVAHSFVGPSHMVFFSFLRENRIKHSRLLLINHKPYIYQHKIDESKSLETMSYKNTAK